jgi:F-type H+-transporting ATPase subunit b
VINFASGDEEMNPLLPPLDEIIIGGVAFLIVFFVLGKILLPKIKKSLEERTDAIEGGLARAEEAQAQAQSELERYRTELADARREQNAELQKAKESGAAAIADMREEGQRIKDEIVAAGHAQIDSDRKLASNVLRQELGKLATELAGRIVGESLEDEARQRRTVDRFLEELEAKAEAESGSSAKVS